VENENPADRIVFISRKCDGQTNAEADDTITMVRQKILILRTILIVEIRV
jgi:hypothetical protein